MPAAASAMLALPSAAADGDVMMPSARGLHSFSFQLNLSAFYGMGGGSEVV